MRKLIRVNGKSVVGQSMPSLLAMYSSRRMRTLHKMPDLFGEEIVLVSALSVRNSRGYKGGYAARPGSGPQGERCGTCRHDVRLELRCRKSKGNRC